MGITLPESLVLPQEGGLSKLLGGIGGGIEKGSLNALKQQLVLKKEQQQKLKDMSLIDENVAKRIRSDPKGKSVTSSEIFKYSDKAKDLISKGMPIKDAENLVYRQWAMGEEEEERLVKEEPGLIKRSIEAIRNAPIMKQLRAFDKFTKEQRKKSKSELLLSMLPESLRERTKRNLRNSAMGILTGQGLSLDEIEKMEEEDPNFLLKAYDMLTSFGIDVPLMGALSAPGAIAGGELGAIAGAPFGGIGAIPAATIGAGAGGAATALGGRAGIMSAYRQWLEHKEQGGPLTFKEFQKRTESVAKDINKNMLVGIFAGSGGTAGTAAELTGLALGQSLAEGKPPSPEDAALNLILMGSMQGARYIGGKMIPKGNKGIERIQKEIKTTAKDTDIPETKIAEEVLAKNPNLKTEDIYQGDSKTINKVLKSIREIKREEASPEVRKALKVAREAPTPLIEKEALKGKEKERRAIIKRISKSPLEEYYAPEKIVEHRPETIAREKARVSELEKHIEPIQKELKEINKSIWEQEWELGKASGNEKKQIRSKIEDLKFGKDILHEHLRNLEFERKYGKKPSTTEEISEQIETSFEKLKKAIEEPDIKQLEKYEKQFEKDKRYIDQAEYLLKQGELPVKGERDFFIKVKEMYRDAYKELLQKNKDFIEDNINKKGKKIQEAVHDAKRMNEYIERRLKRAESDIVRQQDKRAIKKMLRESQGSFYKHQLKNLRSDVEAFQKDIFKYHRIKNAEELKTIGATKESFRKLKEYSLNPTKENIVAAAKEIGVPKDELISMTKEVKTQVMEGTEETLKESVERMGKRFEKAAGEKEARAKFKRAKTKEAKSLANKKLKTAIRKKSNIMRFLVGTIVGTLRQFGVPIPRALIKYIYPGAAAVAYTTGGLLAALKWLMKKRETIEYYRLLKEGDIDKMKRFRAKRTAKQLKKIANREPTYIPGFLQ